MKVKEINGKFKIWSIKDWCYLCELVDGKWQDIEFNTREEAEKEIERIGDHLKAIETQDWEWYSKKWNIELQ